MELSDRERAAREIELRRELRVRRALKDTYYWLTTHTRTKDEQNLDDPYRPFPDREYFRQLLSIFPFEPIWFIKKSRTMMLSWLVSGYCAHLGFCRPATGVVFQSQDEDRAVHDVENVKVLWENSDPELRGHWPLAKPLEKQSYNRLELANGSWFLGIPGNPDKIRSEHPTIYVADEAAFMTQFHDAYNTAKAARVLQLFALSSAEPGEFEDVVSSSRPCDWPDYAGKAPLV